MKAWNDPEFIRWDDVYRGLAEMGLDVEDMSQNLVGVTIGYDPDARMSLLVVERIRLTDEGRSVPGWETKKIRIT